jgi:hypothetical protein
MYYTIPYTHITIVLYTYASSQGWWQASRAEPHIQGYYRLNILFHAPCSPVGRADRQATLAIMQAGMDEIRNTGYSDGVAGRQAWTHRQAVVSGVHA